MKENKSKNKQVEIIEGSICHVCSNFDNFYLDFMKAQQAIGLNIRVFYFRAIERGQPSVEAPYLDISLNYNNLDRIFFLYKENRIFKDFLRLYDVNKFSLLHAHTLFSNGYIAYKTKKRFGIPYIVAVRNMDVNVFFRYRLNLRKLGIDILKEAEKIVFISEPYRENVLSKYVPPKYKAMIFDKSIVISNGISEFFLNNKFFERNKRPQRELKIITVGYISKSKNQMTVCNAVKRLNDIGINTEYIVVGRIINKKVFNEVMKNSFVRYIPFLSREELISEYRNSDIFVMPSKHETFGLVYAEAMSQGLPIIYTRGQGFDGQFEEGEVGYSVQYDSPEEISERVIDIINNYEIISQNCIEKVDKFDWNKIAMQYKGIYEFH